MGKNHIVIAVYNENIDWISMIDINVYDIFVYNKGSSKIVTNQICKIINLVNTGRESHTYLHHIIDHYDNLPEQILFFQGSPHDHVSKDFLKQINEFDCNSTIHNFSKHCLTIKYDPEKGKLKEYGYLQQGLQYTHSYWENVHDLNCPLMDVYQKLYGLCDLQTFQIQFIPGANFSACREMIMSNPKSFYIKCIDILNKSENVVNPTEGHSFERLWKHIFEKNCSI